MVCAGHGMQRLTPVSTAAICAAANISAATIVGATIALVAAATLTTEFSRANRMHHRGRRNGHRHSRAHYCQCRACDHYDGDRRHNHNND